MPGDRGSRLQNDNTCDMKRQLGGVCSIRGHGPGPGVSRLGGRCRSGPERSAVACAEKPSYCSRHKKRFSSFDNTSCLIAICSQGAYKHGLPWLTHQLREKCFTPEGAIKDIYLQLKRGSNKRK